MSTASAERTSADDDPIGPHAKRVADEIPWVTSPVPSIFGGRVSSRTTCGCCQLQFRSVFDGDDALLRRDVAAKRQLSASSCPSRCRADQDVAPRLHAGSEELQHDRRPIRDGSIHRSSAVGAEAAKLIAGPSRDRRRMIAFTRLPSGNRRIHHRVISSTRRPTCTTMPVDDLPQVRVCRGTECR